MKANWSATVIYEDSQARETAVSFCDALIKKFWATHDFDLNWVPFETLDDTQPAEAAAAKASKADLLIFATSTGETVPLHVRTWNENWMSQRAEREGVLIGLSGNSGSASKTPADSYLRTLALRAGLDYLTEMPENLAQLMPETLESCTERAHEVTSLLADIMVRRPPPPNPDLTSR
jgi:hypothetical protein